LINSLFCQAIAKGSEERAVYDSRAAVLEKLGKPEDALKDCRMVIKIAPKSWTVSQVPFVCISATPMNLTLQTTSGLCTLGSTFLEDWTA
jgi:hypothetical protein